MTVPATAPPASIGPADIPAEPFIVFGMVVRPYVDDDAPAAARLLPTIPSAVARMSRTRAKAPEALAADLARDGSLFVVEDDERRPMGLVRIRHRHGLPQVGWHLDEAYLGKGLGALLAEGVAQRLFRSGAEQVWFRVLPGARAARRALESLGFASRAPGAYPLEYGADAQMFEARPRRGTALLPTPAERRRRPSDGEQGVVVEPGEWHPAPPPRVAKPTPSNAFAAPVEAGSVTLRQAVPEDLPVVLATIPTATLLDGTQVPESERETAAAEAIRAGGVLLAIDAGDEAVGSVSVGTHPSGTHEMGWFVVPGRRREGIGTLIASAAAGRMLEAGLGRVTCRIAPDNAASLRIAESLGFEPGARPAKGMLGFAVTPESFTPRASEGLAP